MRMLRTGALFSCGLLLASCGGGGDGGGTQVVTIPPGTTPTPTPPPPPPPPPATGRSTGEVKPPADAVVSSAVLEFTRTGSTTSARSFGFDGVFRLAYSVASRTYTLMDDLRTRLFGPSEFLEENGDDNIPPGVVFRRSTIADLDALVIAKGSAAVLGIVPSHGAYGAWQHTDLNTGGSRFRLTYFTYGSPTPLAAMPRSGRVRYRIPATGNYVENGGLFLTESDIVVDVDFAAGTLFAAPLISGRDAETGVVGGLRGFRTRATISGNTASGSIDSDIAVDQGRFRYTFYGPDARELAFIVSGGNERDAFVTAGVGVRVPS